MAILGVTNGVTNLMCPPPTLWRRIHEAVIPSTTSLFKKKMIEEKCSWDFLPTGTYNRTATYRVFQGKSKAITSVFFG